MKASIGCVLAVVLSLSLSAGAAVQQGDTELAIAGSLTMTQFNDESGFDMEDDTTLSAQFAIGHFFTDNIEVLGQAFGMWASEGQSLYDLGVSGKYHFLTAGNTVPYVGGQFNAAFFKSGGDGEDSTESGYLYGPLGGVKFFVSEKTTMFAEYQLQLFGGSPSDFIDMQHVLLFGISFLFK